MVILPDSGNRYLSKIFDDTWMRENGFLPENQGTDSIAALLETCMKMPLVVARSGEEMNTVVEKMHRYGISQLPVVDDLGRLIGGISEADILDYLLRTDHVHHPLETIAAIINPNVHTVQADSRVESVLPAFENSRSVIIVDSENRPVGMLTKIDLIDYLTQKSG